MFAIDLAGYIGIMFSNLMSMTSPFIPSSRIRLKNQKIASGGLLFPFSGGKGSHSYIITPSIPQFSRVTLSFPSLLGPQEVLRPIGSA